MFQALLKAEPCKQVVTRPQLIVADQQTGCVQVGQQVPIVTALEAASQNGSTVYIARTEMRSTGVQLQVTPQIKQEGKTVLLRVQGNFAEMEGAPVQMPVVTAAGQAPETANAVRTVAFLAAVNSREFQTTVELPAGCATVICTSGATGVNGRKTSETLWVLTAHPVGKTK
jgi:type II secretory pathway component GspD/PulD (secretin)